MAHEHNKQSMDKKQNLARFFMIQQQHVAWVSLAVALLWGIYGLLNMPQRKDPDIPVRQAMVIVPWQGTSAEQVEQLVTRKVEQALASNQWVTEIKSASRTGSAMVRFDWRKKESTTGTRNWTTSRSGWTRFTTSRRAQGRFCMSRTSAIRLR